MISQTCSLPSRHLLCFSLVQSCSTSALPTHRLLDLLHCIVPFRLVSTFSAACIPALKHVLQSMSSLGEDHYYSHNYFENRGGRVGLAWAHCIAHRNSFSDFSTHHDVHSHPLLPTRTQLRHQNLHF